MFDTLEINKNNQDMAIMRLKEDYKKGNKITLSFSKDMDYKDIDNFSQKVDNMVKELQINRG